MATQHLKLHPLTGNTDHDTTGLVNGQLLYVQNPTSGVQSSGLSTNGTGGLTATTFSATTISGGTLYSGSTNLYSIFLTAANVSASTVSAGSNVTVNNVGLDYNVSVVGSPSFNNVTFSGTAIGGTVQAGAGTFTSLSATTLSGGTILSGSTNLYSIFATAGSGVQAVQPGSNITTGGTLALPVINLAASPSVNNLTVSGTANVTGALQSGGTDLNNIYVQGSGTNGTIPLWTATRTQANSVITQAGTGVTVMGSIYIYGNVDVLGTASTFNTQTVQTADNNITMNLSGSHVSAFGGGINVLSGTPANTPSTWTIDSNGAWSANTQIFTSAITVNGGAIISGSTNLYQIFATAGSGVQAVVAGTNITTGGTASIPIINLTDSPSVNNITFSGTAIGGTVQAGAGTFTSLSATTLSGGTILSGSTNLYSIFTTGPHTQVQPGSNITTGGTTALPTVNLVASPSVNNITFSGTAIGGNIQAAAVTATSLSAATLSGGTILSGSTNLYSIFATTGQDLTTASNGLSLSGYNVTLGGTLTGNTTINGGNNTLNITGLDVTNGNIIGAGDGITELNIWQGVTYLIDETTNGSVYIGAGPQANQNRTYLNALDGNIRMVAGVGGGLSRFAIYSTGQTVTNNGTNNRFVIVDAASKGLVYNADYKANFTFESLVTKRYVDSSITGVTSAITQTAVQGGTNIITGGTASVPTVNLVASPSVNSITASGASSFTTLSATTMISGSTNLYQIFAPFGQDATTASNGLTKSGNNITLGGSLTAATTVVLGGNALQLSGEGASSTTIAWSGGPYYTRLLVNGSGSQLKSTFGTFGDNYFLASDTTTMNYTDGGTGTSMRIKFDGTNMYVTDAVNSRGLEYLQNYAPQFLPNSLVTKFYVDNAITGITSAITSTQVQPGSNITTGGTAALPVVSLVASPSVNNLTVSGTTTAQGISGTTIYASQFFQMTPYTGANPTSTNNNDVWFYSAATGIITLNYKIGGVVKGVELS